MVRKSFSGIIAAILFATTLSLISFESAAQKKKDIFIADRVIAVIGDRMILQSDLEMAEAMMKEQERIPFTENFTDDERAMLLNRMMTQKLLAAQAVLDSIPLEDSRVITSVQEHINKLVEDLGSIQKVEERYRKPIYMLRVELMDQMKEQMLAELMRQSVESKVKITPDEVKNIIKSLGKDSIPTIPEQYEYSEIVIKAPSDEISRSKVKERLLELRDRIMKGGNFAALATLYSDDTESAKKGGEIDIDNPQYLQTAYADALVSLTVGQVSNIVETEYGFHIIQLIEKNGNKYRSRHILLRTKFSLEDIEKATNKLDSIKTEIEAGRLKFEDAALKFSQEESSNISGGMAVNSNDAEKYGNTKMKSNKFFINDLEGDYQALKDLKEDEISKPFQTYDKTDNLICKIVRLKSRTPEHIADVKQDYSLLVDYALSIKKERIYSKWLKEQIAKMYIRIEEPFSSFKLISEEWSK